MKFHSLVFARKTRTARTTWALGAWALGTTFILSLSPATSSAATGATTTTSSPHITPWHKSPPSPSGCRDGATTQLIARSCANVWPSEDAKFRWPDLSSKCDPTNILCDSAHVKVAKTLKTSDCADVKILKVLDDDHLAKIRCARSSDDLLINLDNLACHPTNVREYAMYAASAPKKQQPGTIPSATGAVIVARAEGRMRAMHRDVATDTRLIVRLLKKESPRAFEKKLKQATDELRELFQEVRKKQNLAEDCEPIQKNTTLDDNQVRAQRTCRLLVSAAQTGDKALEEAKKWGKEMPSSDPARWQATALKKITYKIVSRGDPYHQADALSMRMLLFQTLYKDHPDLPRRLKLIRLAKEAQVHDDQPFWELHAGFVFGGRRLLENSGGGYDCSDFAQSLLISNEKESVMFSTLRLKRIARHLSGEIPRKKISKQAARLASCFSAVDVRSGKTPQPGDFVVSNNEALKDGHVAIVKEFLGNHSILTIEAAGGGANTIMSKTRPLLEPAPQCSQSEEQLPVRPDLYVLRLKTPLPQSCPLRLES